MPRRADDDEPVMLSFRVPRSLRDRIAAVANATGVPIQEIGRCALEAELEIRVALLAERQAVLAELARREAELRRVRGRQRRERSHSA